MRQPEQRLISNYNWVNSGDRDSGNSLQEYAEVNQGCAVRMLTHPNNNPGYDGPYCGDMSQPLTKDDEDLAKLRLAEFAFVGLTDEWELSICLWRAMFGGLCYGSGFEDTRLPKGWKHPMHDTTVLNGFVDSIDGELYLKAKEIFRAKLQLYGVSDASCKPCWEHADELWSAHT